MKVIGNIMINGVEYTPLKDWVSFNENEVAVFWGMKYIPMRIVDSLEDNIMIIKGVEYIPLAKASMFISYSYSRLRGLVKQKKIPTSVLKKVCSLILIKRDFLPTLEVMYHDPEKHEKQKFCIEQYYEGKGSVDTSKQMIIM